MAKSLYKQITQVYFRLSLELTMVSNNFSAIIVIAIVSASQENMENGTLKKLMHPFSACDPLNSQAVQ